VSYDIPTAKFKCDDCEEPVKFHQLVHYEGGEYCRECAQYHALPFVPFVTEVRRGVEPNGNTVIEGWGP